MIKFYFKSIDFASKLISNKKIKKKKINQIENDAFLLLIINYGAGEFSIANAI